VDTMSPWNPGGPTKRLGEPSSFFVKEIVISPVLTKGRMGRRSDFSDRPLLPFQNLKPE
jgi:hypothetical protein